MTQNKFDLPLKFGRYLGMWIRLMVGMQERWQAGELWGKTNEKILVEEVR